MDIPALLDACDIIDPMVDHKSMMTYITQFRAYEQLKRSAVRDHGDPATICRLRSAGSIVRANFSVATTPASPSVLPSSSTRPIMPSSTPKSNALLPTRARPTAAGANLFSPPASLTRTQLPDWCGHRWSFSTDSPPLVAGLPSGVRSSMKKRRPLCLSLHSMSSLVTKTAILRH